ncbi:hypothetical protein PRECH8_03790 [Insulibacter thermoxylanivorax]|uniref:Uncharacterized protein n=1 Tax=Insulibacter thermoxylanivorax TaxID=2749268 RepID=A0A916QDI1_9BACL|nr:hypothetical protein PRECH8_03790 [Insulibacter thermoxylanivorax]
MSFSSVAAYIFTGILTRPKLMAPFQIVCIALHLLCEALYQHGIDHAGLTAAENSHNQFV